MEDRSFPEYDGPPVLENVVPMPSPLPCLDRPLMPVTWGVVGLYLTTVRVWATVPDQVSPPVGIDVPDVWWGRAGQDLWIGHESWPVRLSYPDLSEDVWASIDRLGVQWWMMADARQDGHPEAVFRLSPDRRLSTSENG